MFAKETVERVDRKRQRQRHCARGQEQLYRLGNINRKDFGLCDGGCCRSLP